MERPLALNADLALSKVSQIRRITRPERSLQVRIRVELGALKFSGHTRWGDEGEAQVTTKRMRDVDFDFN